MDFRYTLTVKLCNLSERTYKKRLIGYPTHLAISAIFWAMGDGFDGFNYGDETDRY